MALFFSAVGLGLGLEDVVLLHGNIFYCMRLTCIIINCLFLTLCVYISQLSHQSIKDNRVSACEIITVRCTSATVVNSN